jgi:hypothetical protein
MHRHAGITLEDIHGCVDADGWQLSYIKHVLAARAARNSGGYRLGHD